LLQRGAGPISRQNGRSNLQTGQLDPRTLLRKRYVIVRAIGRGGMGAVYEAKDTKHNASCAIKEMSLSTVPANERAQAIQNFLAEARILSRLNHTNLPAFTDFFTEGTRHFLVMEFIDGRTLEELLEANNGPFSEHRVLGWARQLCDVLEYLHSQQPPIIFRDLKPGNIMLTRSRRIKLIDFGIARIFRSTGSQDTQLLGTPGFAPPEQYGSAQTDERSDIYSLAMTLFQLMADAVNEQGFGLKNVHLDYPHISAPVARVLEKATSLKPDERYESVVVFRRALLGIGTFRFEHGGEATTPDELADLCSHYPDEAADYLFAGEIESWLQEIGEGELARAAKRIRQTVGDPEIAIDRLFQVVGSSAVHTHGSTGGSSGGKSQTGSSIRLADANSQTSRSGRVQEPMLTVEPRKIDFGQVYPGLSAPILLTISGTKSTLISGSIQPVDPWILVDQTTFDGVKNPVNVRVDSTRLRGSTHYTGTIMITPDESEREVAVTIELDVLGYTTTTIGRKPASQAGTAVSPNNVAQSGVGGRTRMAPQATITEDQPLDSPRIREYKAKYGSQGSDGWDPLPTPSPWMKHAITFTSAFITAGSFYAAFSHLPSLPQTVLLQPPWFTAVLVGLVLFAALGVLIVNLFTHWDTKEAASRISTSLSVILVLLGLGETGWQNFFATASPVLHFFLMLLLISLAATIGAMPRISNAIIKGALWGMHRVRLLMITSAMVVGGVLGFALTNGVSCFTPFGVLLGIGVGALLVMRVDRLLKQKTHP
jgi:serine/threonine protein kinase